jgi:hypothetical protein
MGFDTRNSATSQVINYLKIVAEKDEKNVTKGKFFENVKKVNGKYVPEVLKSSAGYPLPFFGYLKNIEFKLENTIKKADGTVVPAPKVSFSFIDDEREIYVLDLPFLAQTGRVSSNLSSLINSLASIEEFGYLKLYITSIKKEAQINYNLNVRNDANWEPNAGDYTRFLGPKPGTHAVDYTKVSWRYKFEEIPPITFEEEAKSGRKVIVDNKEEHQKFFINVVNEEILPKVKSANYKFKDAVKTEVDSKTTTTSVTTKTKLETAIGSMDDDTDLEEDFSNEIGDDLPF